MHQLKACLKSFILTGVARDAFYQFRLIQQLCPFLEKRNLAMGIHALVTSRLDLQ